jgi:LysR family transcriptional regulator, transcription activator of glutamate synthase operon
MELLQLKYFLAAAKTENFSQVARLYCVPASTISKSISMLEKELGIKLFNRQSNKLTLNDAGKIFSENVSAGLDYIEKGVSSLKNQTENTEIKLLVLCARKIVTDFIGEYKIKAPHITFKINHNSTTEFKDYDLCICDASSVPANFNIIPLFHEKYGIAVNKYNSTFNDPIRLADLSNEKFIMMYKDAILTKDTINFCKKYGFDPKTDIICEDPLYVRQYVEIGLGVTFIPMKSWKNLFSDKVRLINFDDESIGRDVVFCFQSSQCSALCNNFIMDFQAYIKDISSDTP